MRRRRPCRWHTRWRGAWGSDDEVLIVRYPPALTAVPRWRAASGRTLLVADSLVYWGGCAAGDRARHGIPRAAAKGVTVGHGPVGSAGLAEAVAATFEEYPSHYAVNPRFAQDRALGRVRGVGACGRRRRTRTAWSCSGTRTACWGSPPGRLTPRRPRSSSLVSSRCARGRGHYALLLAEVARLSALRGAARLVISKQAGNVAVQRAWHRAGLTPFATFTTLHAIR